MSKNYKYYHKLILWVICETSFKKQVGLKLEQTYF